MKIELDKTRWNELGKRGTKENEEIREMENEMESDEEEIESDEDDEPTAPKAGLKVRSSGSTVLREWKPSCSCGVEFIAGTVLDPFVGSGTVLKIARDLRLNGVGFELNAKYAEYARSRVNWGETLSGYDYELLVLLEGST